MSEQTNALILARSRILELEQALRDAREFIDTVHDGEYGYSDCTRDELVERIDCVLARSVLNKENGNG